MNTLTTEQIDQIIDLAKQVRDYQKSAIKAHRKQIDDNGNRKGIRGGKSTTLNARVDNYVRLHDSALTELKNKVRLL
jgi:hypothetical protein